VCLGESSAVAVARAPGARHVAVVPLDVTGSEPDAEALSLVFAGLASRLAERHGVDAAGARIDVALLPPFVDVRLVRLPRLTRSEAETVIRRDAARYFTGNGSARTIGLTPAASTGGGPGGRDFLAASASAALVDAVHAAARAAGWETGSVVPAHGAWLALAGRSPGTRTLLALEGGVAYLLRVRRGRCLVVRRIPAALQGDVLEALGEDAGQLTLLAGTEYDEWARRLLANGWNVGPKREGAAAETAASNAARSTLELLPSVVVGERRRRSRRNASRAAGAAVLLVAAAAGVGLWGARRELAAVRAERAAIGPEVAPLLAARDSIDRMAERARVIALTGAKAPRWTRALFDLALLLPQDAYVTSLHTTGDTLVVEASSDGAGLALQALRKAGSLEDIRLVGTVERDMAEGTTTAERFRFRARLKPPVAGAAGAGIGSASAAQPGEGRRP
jgi:Tfp pilus assembly protein PilN